MTSRKRKYAAAGGDATEMLEAWTRDDVEMQAVLAEERSKAAIARQIYDLRTARGLTQRQLAERIGTQQPVIARLEDAGANRGVYILPNLLTTAGLFCGIFSIAQTLHGFYFNAALAVIGAMVFDILDGRVARLTRTTSRFGEEIKDKPSNNSDRICLERVSLRRGSRPRMEGQAASTLWR